MLKRKHASSAAALVSSAGDASKRAKQSGVAAGLSFVHAGEGVIEIPDDKDEGAVVAVPNPHPLRPIPNHVLQEEDYTEAISALIERDFFPDLPHLRLKQELLQARRHGDKTRARELLAVLSQMPRPTPASTPVRGGPAGTSGSLAWPATPQLPAGGSTPNLPGHPAVGDGQLLIGSRISDWERDDEAESVIAGSRSSDLAGAVRLKLQSGKEVVVDLQSVRLDDFQRVFTSEDNASFEALLEKDMERRRQKEWWIEDAERKHNTQVKKNALMLEAGEMLPPGTKMMNVFKGRNSMSFGVKEDHYELQPEKPRCDVRNTRFTTAQMGELDDELIKKVAKTRGEWSSEAAEAVVSGGKFDATAFNNVRAIGGRLDYSTIPTQTPQVNGYPVMRTPDLLPGVGGMSPLMTFGVVASTPRALDEGGSSVGFRITEQSDREKAAERLQRGATSRLREAKEQAKAERLRSLGLTPSTPARSVKSTPGSSVLLRQTPGSLASKVTPLSPIGQLIEKARRAAQKGGRLGISGSGPPSASHHHRRSSAGGSRQPRFGAHDPSVEPSELPASITDGLL